MKSILIATAAVLGFILSLGSAKADMLPMPMMGGTSQPIGHYEFCQRYADQCGRNSGVSTVELSRTAWNRIVEINASVNIGIFPRTDQEMHGIPELWSYPTAEGDCEDYALLKQYMLERAGFPRSALLITVLRQQNGDGHAVLTVRTDRGDFILDNLNDKVVDWKDTDYRYLKRQSEKNSAKWVSIADDRNILVGSVE